MQVFLSNLIQFSLIQDAFFPQSVRFSIQLFLEMLC